MVKETRPTRSHEAKSPLNTGLTEDREREGF